MNIIEVNILFFSKNPEQKGESFSSTISVGEPWEYNEVFKNNRYFWV